MAAKCLAILSIVLVCSAWAEDGTVTRVLDGDTVDARMADGTVRRLRFIGVNSPELSAKMPCEKRWAQTAKSVVTGMLLGQVVRLETDVEVLDRYGRTLAYVYVPQREGDDFFVNAFLLQAGFAWVGESGDNVRFRPVFKLLEAEAKSALRGLWAE